jgi:type I restriction enzyme S subunit
VQTRFVSLGSISSRVDYGLTASATEAKTGNKFLRITDIREERIDWREVPYCQCSYEDGKKYALRTGDIVFARTGSVGNSCLIRKAPEGSVFASYLIRIRPKRETVDSVFLSYFFRTSDYWRQIMGAAVGAIHLGLNATKLKQLVVPLPPLPEQQRIAEVLSKADRLRRLRRTARELSDTYLQSVFLEMFGDPMSNPMEWEIHKLGKHLAFITSGGRGWAKYYFASGDRFIRSLDVQMNRIADNDAAFVTPPDNAEAQRTRVQPGDVLLTITGSRIGRVAPVPDLIGRSYVSQHVAILRPDDALRPDFLSMFLSLEQGGQQQIQRLQYGQTKPGLGFEQIRSFMIPVPPLDHQKKFTRVIRRFERLRVQQREAEHQAEHLFQTLLHQAFRREL